MSHPASLTLENVRCFAGPQTGQIRRVTLLGGDNNLGKSSFLGCYRAFVRVSTFANLEDRNYFDDEPFRMGGFSTIARQGAGQFTVEGDQCGNDRESVRLEYRAGSSPYPEERSITIRFPGESEPFRIARADGDPDRWRVEGPRFHFDLDQSEVPFRQISTWLSKAVRSGDLPCGGDPRRFRRQRPEASDEARANFSRMARFLAKLPFPKESGEVVALPRATAGPGRWRSAAPYPGEGTELWDRVGEIGKRTGLFSAVRTAARGPDGAVELFVEMPDGWRNIKDVGLGISSVLPLMVAMCEHGDDATFLMQQPENHLHPMAQAELATVMAMSRQHFLIETHSDHLVDRFRICAMRGDMEPEDFQLLYFETIPEANGSRIHSIGVDENGNLRGAPRNYRRFFLDESRRLLFASRARA